MLIYLHTNCNTYNRYSSNILISIVTLYISLFTHIIFNKFNYVIRYSIHLYFILTILFNIICSVILILLTLLLLLVLCVTSCHQMQIFSILNLVSNHLRL